MNVITETSRLLLREFSLDDAPYLFKLNADEEVLKYTGDVPFKNIAEARLFVKNYRQYQLYKRGRWAVILKGHNQFLGWTGLKYHPDKNYTEVGYRFLKHHWGNGYATEATKASFAYGFKKLQLKVIYAHVHQHNYASIRVIEKCGMNFVKKFMYNNMPALLYVKHNSP